MSRFKNLKPHKVVADAFNYKYVIAGRPKAGKTSLVYGIVKEKYNGDLSKLLLVAFEKGYNALNGIFAEDMNEWTDFVELVDDLIAEKDDIPFRIIAIDTVDEMAKMATSHLLKVQSRKQGKKFESINDLAYGKGYELLDNMISEQLQKLDKAGFSLIYITHDKDRTFETREGLKYDKTTLSLSGRVRDLILNQVDFIIFVELGKELEKGVMVDKRWIYFRGDSGLEAGSRFKNVPHRIEYSYKGFIETVEKAIEEEYDGDKEAVEKARKEQNAQKEKEAKEFIKKVKLSKEELHEQILGTLTKLDRDKKIEASKYFAENYGTKDPREIEDIDTLTDILKYAKELME